MTANKYNGNLPACLNDIKDIVNLAKDVVKQAKAENI